MIGNKSALTEWSVRLSARVCKEIAMIVLTERFHRKAKEYEVSWLDELANALRDGDSFSETDLYDELMGKPKKELVKRYKNA